VGLEHISPDGISPPMGYTHVVKTSGSTTVYVAGQVARDADGSILGDGDLEAQARKAYENLRTALAAAGASPSDVAKTTAYIVGYTPELLQQLGAGRGDFFGDRPPASTLVGVQALGRPEFLVEVEAVAVLD
jgi:enamine deaminase RidA (YjgF/YER057c/UK114 family)